MQTSLKLGLLAAVISLAGLGFAQERRGGGGRPEEHRAAPRREAPPKFRPHAPGARPHGPVARQQPRRVLAPRMVERGHREWAHWNHPDFQRPLYYWNWAATHTVSCVAEDSYGDQYPVTEQTWPGFANGDMTEVEDNALDRCYSESGGDTSCYLATCSHF
ncbi:MAG TPA: hypothetical protein VMB50_22855 [Myxococcales bacterium]|nr:hypothetical protein [Myxococcales bacterium]